MPDDELERLRLENHMLRGGAFVRFDGPPGRPLLDDYIEAVERAEAKVAWAVAQVDAARNAAATARAQLEAFKAQEA